MQVSRKGALTMLVATVLWAVTPAIACMIPLRPMTQAEHECCKKMAQQCGSSAMPSSHSCCQGRECERAVSPALTYSSRRPFDVTIIPETPVLLIASKPILPASAALEAPPPEASPGFSFILRV